ncbi:MAG: HAMP domain-containing histidine kinase [Pigmentiphaga sp.]|nr:HAMP domain-containing histidine kinase [Pigmentiphaga sp.]
MPWAEAPGAAGTESRGLARRLQALGAGHVRQATATAFIFLLVTLLTMASGAALIEGVLNSHVRELVLNTIQAQETAGWKSAEDVALARRAQDGEPREGRSSLVVDAMGSVRHGAPGLWPALGCELSRCHGWHRVRWQGPGGQRQEWLGLAVPLADGGLVYDAYDVLPMLERVRVLPLIAGAGLFVAVLLSIVASMRFGAHSLARVEDIRRTLQRYAGGESAARVQPRAGEHDELESLALSVNQALDRINTVMDEVRAVSSHLAHELGTPLTRLHHRLFTVFEAGNAPAAVRDEMVQALDEVERIQRMSNAILRIGAVESGRCQHQFEAVPASALLNDVADYFQPLAEQRGVTVQTRAATEWRVHGDRALLMQALSNLLDNALKYAHMGKVIELYAVPRGDGRIELGVADRGPGIAPLQREQVRMRFVRLESRDQGSPGYGLGLSLVQAIVRLHGGSLLLTDNITEKGAGAVGLKAALILGQADRREAPESVEVGNS